MIFKNLERLFSMKQSAERDTTLDIAKGVSILLMTVSHLLIFKNFPKLREFNETILVLFKMPLFIFISGILFSNRLGFKDFFVNKFDALIKPILVIFCGSIIVAIILNHSLDYSFYEWIEFSNRMIKKYYYSLWFPLVLFVTTILFKSVVDAKSKFKPSIFMMVYIILITLLILVTKQNIKISLFLTYPILYFLIILSIGYLFKKYHLIHMMYRTDMFIFSVLIFIWYVTEKEALGVKMNLYMNQFGALIPTVITIISGITIILYLSKQISKTNYLSKILIYCSKASFFILAFHVIIGNYIIYPYLKDYISDRYLLAVVTYIPTIAFCIAIYKILFRTKVLKYLLLPKKLLN